MGIKDFQQFNICGDNGNKISFVSSLQLCRTKLSKSGKYFMADDGQKLKGNKVVAVLLRIMEKPPKHRQDSHKQEQISRCKML